MDLFELLQKNEPLCPELKNCVYDGEIGKMISHPLVHEIVCVPQMYALYNAQLKFKKEQIEQYRAKENWSNIIWMHEKPYRVQAFMELDSDGLMTDKQYWPLLGEIIVNVENLWQHLSDLHKLLEPEHRPINLRHLLMDEEEQARFKKLPESFQVFRGCQEHNKKGLSWTIDKKIAEFFAKRYNKEGQIILTALCKKVNAYTLFLCRNEQEIFVDPATLEKIRRVQ